MKKTLECEATILPDGHLAVPEEVAVEIAAGKAVRVRLRIEWEEPIEDLRDGWQILREMPQTGGEGKHDRTAEYHDRILYNR